MFQATQEVLLSRIDSLFLSGLFMGFVDDKKNFAGFIIQVKTKCDSVQNLQPFFVKSQKITEENKCNHEVNPDRDKRKKSDRGVSSVMTQTRRMSKT